MSMRPSIAATRAVSRAVQPSSTLEALAPIPNPATLTPMPALNPLHGPDAGPPIPTSGVFFTLYDPE